MTPVFPELLAPAGTLAMLDTAFAFGADAVYAGQPRYSLRVRNNDFGDLSVLAEGIARARRLGKAFYLVSNIYPQGAKLKTWLADLAPAVALAPDALIMADPGLILLARENWPEMPIHLSVQANTVNAASVRFWKQVGISRVILSRELSLEQIAEIRQACPDTELEVFVHGALCVAYSGRCLLSGYFNHRDPNQGTCTNSCRWSYDVHAGRVDASGDVWMIEETERRAGSYMPIEEDEHGTYILNSKDLRAIEHVQRLVEIGVDSLKIEGRTKSPYYVARSCQAYRRAIDDAVAGRPFDMSLLAGLEDLANRGYTDGFFQRHHDADYQNLLRGHSVSNRSQYVADVTRFDPARGRVELAAKNRFAVGDRVSLILPAGIREVFIDDLEDAEGSAIRVVPGGGHQAFAHWPADTVGAFVARHF
jgi:putative protease